MKRKNISLNIPGVKIELDKESEEFVDYFLKKAKLLNGFFQVNRLKQDHEDLQIIAMYLAVQMAMKIIKKSDLEEIQQEIYKIAEALEPRFNQ